ncbi:Arc family DNA-binding protein [Pseudomonas fluorescens]|uniref:Arc-like DNA binding domain-containing protein n=1 Tax=Pseudomonas fluorescens TaxID=294 RepID=A0A423LFU0_PSEFL|nr:Arc family DNA-binding protein [Pseudomonas fluorescens]RON67166.1 hypothetical protein BK671_14400 [Pseudomonas fluorescens]
MTQVLDKFLLRLPDGLRLKLKLAAATNKRSLNSEIVARMERALADIATDRTDEENVFNLVQKVLFLKKKIEELKAGVDFD